MIKERMKTQNESLKKKETKKERKWEGMTKERKRERKNDVMIYSVWCHHQLVTWRVISTNVTLVWPLLSPQSCRSPLGSSPKLSLTFIALFWPSFSQWLSSGTEVKLVCVWVCVYACWSTVMVCSVSIIICNEPQSDRSILYHCSSQI